MARLTVPTDYPARLVFPVGSFVKVTNTGNQIAFISESEDDLRTVDFTGTPTSGLPLPAGETESWWNCQELWARGAQIGEVEFSAGPPPNATISKTPRTTKFNSAATPVGQATESGLQQAGTALKSLLTRVFGIVLLCAVSLHAQTGQIINLIPGSNIIFNSPNLQQNVQSSWVLTLPPTATAVGITIGATTLPTQFLWQGQETTAAMSGYGVPCMQNPGAGDETPFSETGTLQTIVSTSNPDLAEFLCFTPTIGIARLIVTAGANNIQTRINVFVWTTPQTLLQRFFQCSLHAGFAGLGIGSSQLTGITNANKTRICSLTISNTGAAATTVSLTSGTGAACATGTIVLVQPFELPAGSTQQLMWTFDSAPTAGQTLETCIASTAAGPVNASVVWASF